MKYLFITLLLFLSACAPVSGDNPAPQDGVVTILPEDFSRYYELLDDVTLLWPSVWSEVPVNIRAHYPNITDYRSLCYIATAPTTLIYNLNIFSVQDYKYRCELILDYEERM